MTIGAWVLAAYSGLFSAAWIAVCLAGLRSSLLFKTLRQLDAPAPVPWPKLSVIVTACDEEATIGPALRTLLAQDYPDLEIVVVDDRSRDATGRIVDEAKAENPRLQVVHITELPKGWLGKVHAMHRGTRIATGEWILYTDADIHFKPGALKRAIAYVAARGLDHFAIAPELDAMGPLHDAVAGAFASSFLFGTRAVDVERPGSSAYVGVGAFNLVRRAAFDRTPGWGWLRLEILDDIGLGYMMKRSGARSGFAIGLDDVTIAWYGSLGEMAKGLEKNLFGALCRYSVARLVGVLTIGALALPAPFVALFARPRPWLPILGVAALVTFAAAALISALRTRRSPVPFLIGPIGTAVLGVFLLRSAWTILRNDGVTWRGTKYPLAELREGQRVKI